ncbi:type IX secretion system outer membrane channel protein PorV [Flavobacteriaceae bacterium]|nr:type IX secretion system outer membrane channel protein PorV [Flavobacteriaceae bacterium]MDA8734046.1 type IX secretion system outer membrane channel protein PorV [Flavobacteriaceae bacterium]MDA9373497.1 type IX secretion system outer membrane channel protein PorV [Flavobacteriaceae bacterium]MDB4014230.1 type IX secretion system outer membrane channel protein PorV [Flavobacteriaceae bacterium]MDB4023721.1 type IX secretion system outer membrane channel protein PorV [Flavobacteriaceae bact
MKKITLSLILILNVIYLFSQERRVITTAVPFLMISADARASGLGEQGVATSPDAFSQHWNPAKYVFLDNASGVGVSYTPYLSKLVSDVFLANINYYNIINERSSWSTSFKYFSLGDIDILQNPQDIPYLENPNEFTLDGSYILKLNDYFSMGVTGRFLMSDVKLQSVDSDSSSANSFAVDISGFYQSDVKAYQNFNGLWRFGFNISNLGPRMKYEELGKKNFIPTNLKLGSAFDFIFDSSNKLSINLELNKLLVPSPSIPILNSNDQIIGYNQADVTFLSGLFKSFGDAPDGFSEELKEITLALGFEYTYDDSFALRIGYFGENENKGARKYITFGTGFKLDDLNLDLSYLLSTSSVISPLENTLRFSFTYNFN